MLRRLMLTAIILVCSSIQLTWAEEDTFQVEVSNREELPAFQVEILQRTESKVQAPKHVLIYHTHTFEAYEQSETSPYQQTEPWRTTDETHNVIAVGTALSASLRALGIEVTHDQTPFEPPNMDDAYERSLEMLESRQNDGEIYDLYIDLHRDALASTSAISKTVNIAGNNVARFMVLVGKGTTGGYEQRPNWEANLLIAQSITDQLNAQYPNLARNVKVKTGRFNQHIADCCVLIECGINTNTLEEVLAGVPYLAEAIKQTLMPQ